MFVTTLKFSQVLERFYEENKYDFLLLFVSSFDGNDKEILKQIVDNAKRIDKITGERICFFYFVENQTNFMNGKPVRLVWDVSDRKSLFNRGVDITMDTADDICRFFGILRSHLPAFILIRKDRRESLQIFSIKDYNDFESLLSPLNTIHSYIDDKECIISRYNYKKSSILNDYYSRRKRTVVTQLDVIGRLADRQSWNDEISRLESRKRMELSRGELDRANRRDLKIAELRRKLEDYQELVVCGEDESVQYPQDELDSLQHPNIELNDIRNKTIEKLNLEINADVGESIVDDLQSRQGYCNAVLKIWDLVRTRGVRISRVVEDIRRKIYDEGYDVFISCKSQDYAKAHCVYEYLKAYGYKPFLADHTLKEIGVDQYTAVIGEVINVCQNMVVFATNVDYLYTPYVHAEWHSFVNDINTGHKPNARLVNVLSPDINIHDLPGWLRDKQCFTTENYKDDLLLYLKGEGNEIIEQLKNEIEKSYCYFRYELNKLYSQDVRHMFDESIFRIEREKECLLGYLDSCKSISMETRMKMECAFKKWEHDFRRLIRAIEQYKMDEEKAWHEAYYESDGDVKDMRKYLKEFPSGAHAEEAKHIIQRRSVSYFPSSPKNFSGGFFGGQLLVSGMEFSFFNPFGRKTYQAFSSIFAPAEVKRKSHMLVQVYLHLLEETEKVVSLAQESQKDAQRRDYIPLQCKLKKGDKVDVLLNIYGESLLMSDKKSMVWQGSFTKCSFDYRVPKDINVDELSCKAILAVGGVPVGEMNFITSIMDEPRPLHPEIISHKYEKVFISYAHKDEGKVKFLAQGLDLIGIDHFFDRKYLKAGDIFPQVIEDYINSADLFVLCWSENASQSEYVKKEYMQALERAYPQIKPQKDAKLSIYPMSIEPRAELPEVMKGNYHFGEV